MHVLDLFAGCGGMSLGFMQAGYTINAAFDNWHPAIKVYRNNFSHPIVAADLQQLHEAMPILDRFAPADMIIGGPPCQDFSSAGKRDEGSKRSNLTVMFARIVALLLPKWVVMENVERTIKSKAYREAYTILATAGYGLTACVLDASLCGVPQQRKRLFLIGEYNGYHQALLTHLHSGLASTPMTIRDYFGESLGIEHYYRHPRSYQRRAVFSIDEPSPTIRGVNRPIPKTYRPHPGDTAPLTPELRPLTTWERSQIQTFPPDFIFTGTKSEREQMIGNAVPVRMAEYVAGCILHYTRIATQQIQYSIKLNQIQDYTQQTFFETLSPS
jgi:DNA (cytosine-5)-methyltransferase 1